MTHVKTIPDVRLRYLNPHAVNADGEWVLYWMTAYRRTRFNFSLDRAIELARTLRKPLVILEAVRIRYAWASDRFHQFMIEGMIDNANALRAAPVTYYPYLEEKPGAGTGLVATFARRACCVVSDDFPCFFHPTMYRVVATKTPVRFELVDSNGLMPMRVADRTFTVAHSYRRWMQKTLPQHLDAFPEESPLAKLSLPTLSSVPMQIKKRWPAAILPAQANVSDYLGQLEIDHQVVTCGDRGGPIEAGRRLQLFVQSKLTGYEQDRNQPDLEGASSLSPYLHFGHISAHEIFLTIMKTMAWNPNKMGVVNGKVNGFWNVGADAEAFLDQLLTWREIGFNMCSRQSNFDRYESLPTWAQTTLAEHAQDQRETIYRLEEFETATTHDPLWNAAQRQLVREGRIHNYLRMLWGKKILHWTPSPQHALEYMIHLNNKYALDGRDPNSYSGIFWILGRYDRAWGPERPIFGKVRYMTSQSTANKWHVKEYLRRYSS